MILYYVNLAYIKTDALQKRCRLVICENSPITVGADALGGPRGLTKIYAEIPGENV